jgi:hypothetical protein
MFRCSTKFPRLHPRFEEIARVLRCFWVLFHRETHVPGLNSTDFVSKSLKNRLVRAVRQILETVADPLTRNGSQKR